MPIQPEPGSLDPRSARTMALLSRAVYTARPGDRGPDERHILAALQAEDPGYRSVLGVSRNSAQAALIEHEQALVLCFRGTDEPADWLDSLDLAFERTADGVFHRGFLRTLFDVWEPLQTERLRLQQQRPRPLFLTGHSLGGALAIVAAVHLLNRGEPFEAVVTFGQPRALDQATAQAFDARARSRCFRFQNNNDVVTQAPTRLMGYEHVGNLLYITESGAIHPDPTPWLEVIDGVGGNVLGFRGLGLAGLGDHAMDLYLDAVEEWRLISGPLLPGSRRVSRPS
ncbi:MAG: lipase family protein [Synechococcaceae cyanobacterium]|nr:lipase family protein [Synechococcaceae cyanobacterium]